MKCKSNKKNTKQLRRRRCTICDGIISLVAAMIYKDRYCNGIV